MDLSAILKTSYSLYIQIKATSNVEALPRKYKHQMHVKSK
jgi:hypothetical protein